MERCLGVRIKIVAFGLERLECGVLPFTEIMNTGGVALEGQAYVQLGFQDVTPLRFALLKCTIQWFFVHSQGADTPPSAFPSPQHPGPSKSLFLWIYLWCSFYINAIVQYVAFFGLAFT